MKKLFLVLLALGYAVNSWAVDGYKEIKFGMKIDELKKTTLCKSEWTPIGSDAYLCSKFPFHKGVIEAAVVFKENKLYRLSLALDEKLRDSVINGLIAKYGEPYSISGITFGKKTKFEKKWELTFDRDTVLLNSNEEKGIVLHYEDRKLLVDYL